MTAVKMKTNGTITAAQAQLVIMFHIITATVWRQEMITVLNN